MLSVAEFCAHGARCAAEVCQFIRILPNLGESSIPGGLKAVYPTPKGTPKLVWPPVPWAVVVVGPFWGLVLWSVNSQQGLDNFAP